MDGKERGIQVSSDLRPEYYDGFRCLAGGCRVSCCKNWKITFDKKDYLALTRRRSSPELSRRMADATHRVKKSGEERVYAEFRLSDGSCPLLGEDSLCELQREAGAEALPSVCRTFPRSESYQYSGYYERSLSLGCEAVAALLWQLEEGIGFRSDPLPANLQKTVKFHGDTRYLPYFQDIRSLCIDMLQDRRISVSQRILLMGLRLQELVKEGADVPQWLAATKALLSMPDIAEISKALEVSDVRSKGMRLVNHWELLLRVGDADPNFCGARSAIAETLNIRRGDEGAKMDASRYEEAKAAFREAHGDREYFFENLAVSLFFHTAMPHVSSPENIWKSYVNFCNIYSLLRFAAVMSAVAPPPPLYKVEGDVPPAPGTPEALFQYIVLISRCMLHNMARTNQLRDELFQNESSSLAHMAILLSD